MYIYIYIFKFICMYGCILNINILKKNPFCISKGCTTSFLSRTDIAPWAAHGSPQPQC